MRVLLIALSLPMLIAASEPAKPAPKKVIVSRQLCAPNTPTLAQDGVADGTRVRRLRKLGEMPPAKQQLTVIRTVDGCSVPTVVRENIGGQ